MAARAVYASKTLNIYVTKADLDPTLSAGVIHASLEIAGRTIPDADILVVVSYEAAVALRLVVDAEESAKVRHAETPPGAAGGIREAGKKGS